MVINTHKILSSIIYDRAQENLSFQLLDYKYFLWGNVRPDIIPGLALKSHYKGDSLNFVIKEIQKLSNIQPSMLKNKHVRNNFSMNIGVISHFLSDFSCYPHYKDWRYKSSMILSHIKFEKGLNITAKNISIIPSLSLQPIRDFESDSLESFIENMFCEHALNENHLNNLTYASSICTEIIKSIISFIFTEKPQAYAQSA
ncbi:MAG: zinc dependent phospholipase C family protein [Desulfitobacteriaceae bacterium]|nr:zinc dependent phospholipase C family protein [Desulfitobacteriaceae bacterium]MDD4345405.1 zinc dependent phospholipase C family protein [Desulfitobacteriaceae bacterium]MDD4402104.1 zinc dependent phospholipase C family protein [Desulfitobacteriaceae bacterium]